MSDFSPYDKDLFGEPMAPVASGAVAERFVFPPFTALDAKSGEWQERKRAWKALGIKSEVGRDDISVFMEKEWVDKNAGKTMPPEISIFDPVLCELMYRWFCPEGGQVVDPFAGGSVRGIVASLVGRRYFGVDLRSEQVEANRDQSDEIVGKRKAFRPDEVTPIQSHLSERDGNRYLLKRDDLCTIHGASGGKARTCWALAKDAKIGLTTAGSRHSPQAMLVATMANRLGLPCVIHTPKGDISSGPVADAVKLGADVIQHPHGYNSVIVKRCREYAAASGYTEIPFGMECPEAVRETRKQYSLSGIGECGAERIVVPVGSGMSLAGILWGMKDARDTLPVLGVSVGASPIARLDKYAPPNWRDMVEIVESGTNYDKPLIRSIGDVDLDPHYEAKCEPFMKEGDLLWVVGHRERVDTGSDDLLPVWLCGDSMMEINEGPSADFIFSCPPYGDLERYSDDPADLSTMEYHTFIAAYKRIILRCVDAMKPDSFACFVVGDFRDKKGHYRNFVSDTISAFVEAGAHLYNEAILLTPIGTACLRVTKQFNSGRKLAKIHQNVLVFVKGDWKRAAQKCIDGEKVNHGVQAEGRVMDAGDVSLHWAAAKPPQGRATGDCSPFAVNTDRNPDQGILI